MNRYSSGSRKTPAASVVIVNYNGIGLLKDCLDSLLKQTFTDFEIILVDNGSTDGSADFVEAGYPGVVLVRNRENLGYGGGNNSGMAAAKGRFYVFLNNDVEVDPGWLGNLVSTAEKDEATGMCASKILNFYDRRTIDNTGLLMYRDGIARGRGRLEIDDGRYDSGGEIFFPSGCACLYKKEVFEKAGIFDEDFFLYVDDVDMGLRARLAGWKCVYVPDAVVYHKYSASTDAYSPLKAFLVERNRIWVMIKCFPVSMLPVSLFYTALRYLMQGYGALSGRGAAGRFAKSGSMLGGILILIRAYVSAFGKLRAMLAKRRLVMAMKTVSRSEFIGWFERFGISASELALKD